jgi:hypothetical protein
MVHNSYNYFTLNNLFAVSNSTYQISITNVSVLKVIKSCSPLHDDAADYVLIILLFLYQNLVLATYDFIAGGGPGGGPGLDGNGPGRASARKIENGPGRKNQARSQL